MILGAFFSMVLVAGIFSVALSMVLAATILCAFSLIFF
jgi:hypothetical protein